MVFFKPFHSMIQLYQWIPSRTQYSGTGILNTKEVNETFKGQIKVFDTCILATVKVGESVYYNMAVEQYSPKSTAGIAYRNFAKELIGYEG